MPRCFPRDPAAMARHWIDQGARRLHLVDLNGAFAGKPKNEPAIKAILDEVGDEIPVQLGGGIRDLDTIERCLDDGISYVIIGTAAVKNPGFLHDACTRLPRPHHRRPRRQGRQGGGRRLVEDDRPRRHRPGQEVRGLRRRSDHLYRHRPRRHDVRRQRRGHGEAGAGACAFPVIASRRHRQHQGRQGAVRGAGRRHHGRHHRPRDLRRQAGLRARPRRRPTSCRAK